MKVLFGVHIWKAVDIRVRYSGAWDRGVLHQLLFHRDCAKACPFCIYLYFFHFHFPFQSKRIAPPRVEKGRLRGILQAPVHNSTSPESDLRGGDPLKSLQSPA